MMSREERHGSCRKLARGPWTLGKTAIRAAVVVEYSVFIPVCLPWGIMPRRSEVPKKKKGCCDGDRGLRLLLAERCCEMRSARLAKSQHAGLARSEHVWLMRLGSLLCGGLQRNGQRARPASLTSRLGRTRIGRPESLGAKLRGAAFLHVVQSCRPCATCAAMNRRPLPSRCYSGCRRSGKRTHSVEMPFEENRGVTRWEAMQRYQNVGREASQTAKWQSP